MHEEQFRFLKSALREGDCFVAEDREISLGLPTHAAMVPVDIHYTTFREKTYSYRNWIDAMDDGRIRYWVGSNLPDRLYGANWAGKFAEIQL